MEGILLNEIFLAWLALVGTGCWAVCFWWMWRISRRQDAMLKELHEQTRQIAQLSKAEHDLIREVHPQVEEIKEAVEGMAEGVPEPRQNSAR